jgi:hypothetical protein
MAANVLRSPKYRRVIGNNAAAVAVDTDLTVGGTLTVTGASTLKKAQISGSGATVTLTAAQSGSQVLFDRAAGIVYTLPAPAVGLFYDFFVTTTITSNAAKVITDAGTTFLLGTILVTKAADGTTLAVFGDGTANLSVSMNGTTTGGIKGTWLRVSCVTATQWSVEGFAQGSGTIATPFANS